MSEKFFWIYSLPVAVMETAWPVIEFHQRTKTRRGFMESLSTLG